MKLRYEKPMLEIDIYELDTSIASNCRYVVDMGPEVPGGRNGCDSYYEISGETRTFALTPRGNYNVDFWQELNCDCYTSASGQYFTS